MKVEITRSFWDHDDLPYYRTSYLLMDEKEGPYGRKSTVCVTAASDEFLDFLNKRKCSPDDGLKVLMEYRKHHLESTRMG